MAQAIPIITLTTYEGDTQIGKHRFERATIHIGKLPRSDLRLDDENISRTHTVIEVTRDGTIEIADLGSTNGTFLNGEKLDRQELKHNDQVLLGNTRIVVEITRPRAPRRVQAKRHLSGDSKHVGPVITPDGWLTQPARQTGTEQYVLSLAVLWGTTVRCVEYHDTSADVTIGELATATYPVPSEHLGEEKEAVLVSSLDSRLWQTHLDPRWKGRIQIADEQFSMAEAIERFPGGRIPLDETTRAEYVFGNQTFLVGWEEVEARPKTTVFAHFDLAETAFLALSLFAHLGFLLMLALIPEEQLLSRHDPYNSKSGIFKAIQVAELEKHEEEKEDDVAEKATKTDKVEKERPSPSKKLARIAPKTLKDKRALTDEEKKARDLAKVKDSGLVKLLNDSSLQDILNDSPMDDLLAAGALGGGLLSSTDPNAPMIAGFKPFAGLSGGPDGGGGSDTFVPTTLGGGSNRDHVRGLSKSDMAKDANLQANKLKDRRVRVRFDAPQVSAGYDREAVRRVIRQNKGAIKWCYQQELQRNPNLAGKIVLAFVITANGSVAKENVKANTMPTNAVGECIARKSRRWRFPEPPDGGIVRVSYPFLFKSNR